MRTKFKFGAIWILAQFGENADLNLEIPMDGMNLYPVWKELQVTTLLLVDYNSLNLPIKMGEKSYKPQLIRIVIIFGFLIYFLSFFRMLLGSLASLIYQCTPSFWMFIDAFPLVYTKI